MLRFIRNNRGTTILESALVLPLFIAFFLVLVNTSILFYNYIVANETARKAGRYMAATGSTVLSQQKGGVFGSNYSIGDTTTTVFPAINGDTANIVVRYKVPVLVPGFSVLLGGSVWDKEVTMEISTKHVVENHVFQPYNPAPHCGDWYGCGRGY